MRFSSAHLALLVSLVVPAAGHAAELITITDNVDTLIFTVPSSPTPSSYDPGNSFTLSNIAVTFDGVAAIDTIAFYTDAQLGGFSESFLYDPFSAQLFSGDVSTPTFTAGVYDFSYEAPGGQVDGTITIAGTPEPSSLVLLGTGVLGLAGGIRRRIKK